MRITTSVIMFYLWVSATGSVLEAIGVADAMGLSTQLSVDNGLQTAISGINSIQGGGLTGESLIGLYTLGFGAVKTLAGGLTAGPRLMIAAGIPAEFVLFLSAPIPLLAGRLVLYALTGRDL